jgi:hypothetical protein
MKPIKADDMTQIDKGAVDVMVHRLEDRADSGEIAHQFEAATMLRVLRAALDAAEAEKRAAVALLQEIATSGRCDFQKVRDTLAAIRQETNDG